MKRCKIKLQIKGLNNFEQDELSRAPSLHDMACLQSKVPAMRGTVLSYHMQRFVDSIIKVI